MTLHRGGYVADASLEKRLGRLHRVSPRSMTLAQFDIHDTSRPACYICAHHVYKRQIAITQRDRRVSQFSFSFSSR